MAKNGEAREIINTGTKNPKENMHELTPKYIMY